MTTFGTLTPSGEVINKIEVDLNTAPSKDPLSFMYGVKRGQDRIKEHNVKKYLEAINHGSLHRDLSQEYLRGFLFGYRNILVPEGIKIKKGQEASYILSHLNTKK